MRYTRLIFSLLFVGVLIGSGFFRPKPTQAHTVTTVGEFQILAGWVTEPGIVGERNTIFIDIMRNNQTIQSADARLRLELEADGERRPVAASPLTTENTLRYNISFIPTATGEYKVHIEGQLEGEDFEVTVSPELVSEADVIQFPNLALSNGDLQAGLISVEQRAAAAEQRANIGLGLGAAGILTGAAGIILGRKKPQ